VYVTHDQEEAMVLSDEIAVMHEGRVLQVAEPETIYTRPANRTATDRGRDRWRAWTATDGRAGAPGPRISSPARR